MKYTILNILVIAALTFCSVDADAKKPKRKLAIQPVPTFAPPVITDRDWVWIEGSYTAVWPDESLSAFVTIFGPGIEEGLQIKADSDSHFKTRVVFVLRALAHSE